MVQRWQVIGLNSGKRKKKITEQNLSCRRYSWMEEEESPQKRTHPADSSVTYPREEGDCPDERAGCWTLWGHLLRKTT